MRLEDIAIRGAGRHEQLHFAAAHADVDRLVAVSVIVERLRRIAGWLTHERFLYVASLHAKAAVAQFVPIPPAKLTAPMRTLEFDEGERCLVLVDQTRLPRETVLLKCRSAE